jgi:hypothetical protein
MDARDDKVELVQHAVRIIERTVGENIGFNSLKNAEFIALALVQPIRFPMLLGDLFQRKAAGIVRGL